jgi:hypothetical protein
MEDDVSTGGERNVFSKLILHPHFNKTVDELNKLKIKIPPKPTNEELDFQMYTYPVGGNVVTKIEKLSKKKLDAKSGQETLKSNVAIAAYDESTNKFAALEGTAVSVSHSLVVHGKTDYINSNLITLYFYTRSKTFTEESSYIKYSEDPVSDSHLDYIKDRSRFILSSVPDNSILFVDGPLIGGQASHYTIALNSDLLKRDIIPIFFVKNSTSNLVTDYLERGKYNSDLHWANKILKPGERTCFFKYADSNNKENAKIFCYMKSFEISPQRIEFDVKTFEKNKDEIEEIMNLVYYLMLVQGNLSNPQVRPIIIAEMYARETLKLFNLNDIMKRVGIVPTINQERFSWG